MSDVGIPRIVATFDSMQFTSWWRGQHFCTARFGNPEKCPTYLQDALREVVSKTAFLDKFRTPAYPSVRNPGQISEPSVRILGHVGLPWAPGGPEGLAGRDAGSRDW